MKKGFVLLETIAVLSIVCVTLIALYGGYIRIIKNVKLRSYYDNTEYIYKTQTISNFLSNVIKTIQIENRDLVIYCNSMSSSSSSYLNSTVSTCSDRTISTMIKEMNIKAIYITKWNTRELDTMSLLETEPTTQKYIKHINDKSGNGYRIIIMYQDRVDANKYQYASLRFVPSS